MLQGKRELGQKMHHQPEMGGYEKTDLQPSVSFLKE
jgi:hypothetical protein